MDSFLRLYALYRAITRWGIVKQIYRCAKFQWKISLWAGKILFFLFAGLQFFLQPFWLYFTSMLLSISLWGWVFDRSRQSAFSEYYRLYPERIKYFAHDYQYVRYLQFREKIQNSYAGSIDDALVFLNEQIDTDAKTSIAAHPIISFLLAAALTVLGGAAGRWEAEYIIGVLLFLIVCLYLFYMVLGILQTGKSDLKEFKRFLLWAKAEQPESLSGDF